MIESLAALCYNGFNFESKGSFAMKKRKGLSVNGLISKLYGGLNMSWINVILFAVGTAVLTAIFLIVRVFRGTSFEMMGLPLKPGFSSP